MATRARRKRAPAVRATPESYLFPFEIQIIGSGWGSCPVELFLYGEEQIRPARILTGEARGTGVLPSRGEFAARRGWPGQPRT